MKTQAEKDALLADLKHHQEIDAFVRGAWLTGDKMEGNGFKGCFYGCTMQTSSSPREKFAEKHDIDLWYVYLTERIFEKLPAEEFAKFPYDSIEIIPLNYDFNKVKSPFHKALLLKQLDWVKDEKVRIILTDTAKLFDTPFSEIDIVVAESARSAASAAWSESAARSAESARSAASAARSAAWSESAASAAWSAAWSAASAARSAAWSESAAESAWSAESAAESAWSAAWSESNFYVWMRDTLFELIKMNP